MKTLKKMMMAFFVMACMGLTVSCEKDNNNGSEGDVHGYGALLKGTWKVDKMLYNGQDVTSYMIHGTVKLTFNENGTGLLNDNGETQNNEFSWVINGNTIKVTEHGITMSFTINSLTDTECTFTGTNMEMDGQMLDGDITIHMTKVGDNPNPGYEDMLVGTWDISNVIAMGQDVTSMLPDSTQIIINANGSGSIIMNGQSNSFSWTVNGDSFDVNNGSATINCHIVNISENQCTFTSSNMEFPGIGTIPGEVTITIVRAGDNPNPPQPITDELTGTSWDYSYSGSFERQGMSIDFTLNMLLSYSTSTTGTLTESVIYSFMGQTESDTENIDFDYSYNVNTHAGSMTATFTDPETGETETNTLPFSYNPTTNTIIVVNPDSDGGRLPETLEFHRVSK